MKLNIFSKFYNKNPQLEEFVSNDDETVITNFTESYLEAYFDGELESSEEKHLEGILGEQYIREEMLKRGELRDIISRQSVLSIPSAHDLRQEKKRVWNEIEHELRAHLSEPVKKEVSPTFTFNFRESILKSLAAGSACLVVGLVYLNISSKESLKSQEVLPSASVISFNESNPSFVLSHPREIKEMVKLIRDDGSRNRNRLAGVDSVGIRELREFEKNNALIANLNSDELSDLGASIIRNENLNSNMLTFVSNQSSYE